MDYVRNKTQFHLHHLPTEKRHPLTRHFSRTAEKNAAAGLGLLLDVDKDIASSLEEWARRPDTLEQAADAVKSVLLSGRKIYIYGCGATGRLAKQMESTFWRPFWKRVYSDTSIRNKLSSWPGELPENRLKGEMTGGDRALISSLEGFEDLELIGRLQMQRHKIDKRDLIICVTEGGETSSVIGTMAAACEQWEPAGRGCEESSRRFLYFVYNNPDKKLRLLDRSRRILEEPGISRINLTTGPQAITGSTRMQAATIETYVIGHILQYGAEKALQEFLTKEELHQLGFDTEISLSQKLKQFRELLESIRDAIPDLARLTDREAAAYAAGGKATYFADQALITVFIDCAERSPTFRLWPLDRVDRKQRRCWIQIWTNASSGEEAWTSFLGRSFRGLDPDVYREPFDQAISDPYLRQAALRSLKEAGSEQQQLYDFSLSPFNLNHRRLLPADVCLAVTADGEQSHWKDSRSGFSRFTRMAKAAGIPVNILAAAESEAHVWRKIFQHIPGWDSRQDLAVIVPVAAAVNDPMGINRHCVLKMVLNAHSTTVMARLGRVTGNSMAHVQPANLKLIGRAVYLIQSHVNEVLESPEWQEHAGKQPQLTYEEAAAVLFEAMEFLKQRSDMEQPAEVPLAVTRVLESLRRSKPVSQEEALEIVKEKGIKSYL